MNLRPAVVVSEGKTGTNAVGHFMTLVRCALNQHPDRVLRVRRIVVHEKKNKPPEYFLQGRSICRECERVVAEAYLRDNWEK